MTETDLKESLRQRGLDCCAVCGRWVRGYHLNRHGVCRKWRDCMEFMMRNVFPAEERA